MIKPDDDVQRVLDQDAKRGRPYDILALMSWSIWMIGGGSKEEINDDLFENVLGYIRSYPENITGNGP